MSISRNESCIAVFRSSVKNLKYRSSINRVLKIDPAEYLNEIARTVNLRSNNCPAIRSQGTRQNNSVRFRGLHGPQGYILLVPVSVLATCRLCNFRLPLGLFLFPVTFARLPLFSSALTRPSGVMEPRNR